MQKLPYFSDLIPQVNTEQYSTLNDFETSTIGTCELCQFVVQVEDFVISRRENRARCKIVFLALHALIVQKGAVSKFEKIKTN